MLSDTMDVANETSNYTQCYYCGTPLWCVIGYVTTTVTILGNILTMCAILLCKKLSSSIANYFVFSLAISDCFVGIFIPYHMLFYILKDFGEIEIHCLLRFGLILFACSSSISNLVLIAADRYVAIVYPLHYTRFVTKRVAYISITIGWLAALSMAAVPTFWNNWRNGMRCEIFNVLSMNYVKFLLCPMFAVIWMTMLFLYSRICKEATGHEKRIRITSYVTSNGQQSAHFGESKSFQMTLMILGCFTICWCPFFITILVAKLTRSSYVSTIYEIFFNLAMINSSLNPLIYSWKNTNFRKAFLCLLKCHLPDHNHSNNFITNHLPSKRNSENGICNVLCKEENERRNIDSETISNNILLTTSNGQCLPTISKHIEDDDDSGLQMSSVNETCESAV